MLKVDSMILTFKFGHFFTIFTGVTMISLLNLFFPKNIIPLKKMKFDA